MIAGVSCPWMSLGRDSNFLAVPAILSDTLASRVFPAPTASDAGCRAEFSSKFWGPGWEGSDHRPGPRLPRQNLEFYTFEFRHGVGRRVKKGDPIPSYLPWL